jgi:hypothetical protein
MRRIAVLLVAGAFGVGLIAPAAGHAATLNPGDIVVADPSAAGGKGALLLINPVTGAQSTVSSGADLSAGASWHAPDGLAMDPTGRILVSDDPIYSGDQAKIIRVNPATGFRTIVAAGGSLSLPVGLGVEPSGKILVADSGVVGAILRIDPVTGAQSTLSSGGSLVSPFGIASSTTTPSVDTPAGMEGSFASTRQRASRWSSPPAPTSAARPGSPWMPPEGSSSPTSTGPMPPLPTAREICSASIL